MRYKLLQENVAALPTAALPHARKSSSSNLRSSPPKPRYLSTAQDKSAQLRAPYIHFPRYLSPPIPRAGIPPRFPLKEGRVVHAPCAPTPPPPLPHSRSRCALGRHAPSAPSNSPVSSFTSRTSLHKQICPFSRQVAELEGTYGLLSGGGCGAYIISPGEHAARRGPAGDCVERGRGVGVGNMEWRSGFDPVHWFNPSGVARVVRRVGWGGVGLVPMVSRD
ncbi:hypothetical protein C8J57DRAFT_1620622 [Mycena rebaudengoi]|nr:hypothetical protein C8J57DRAFT_1620622 [Mycena rebaudengoi]